ncbi:MAG: L-ribulose-5-phosphate 4-epimerase AraD [Candidatus Pacebacteria bacterium]|nr:L-ribulose-5-phosphate 4-epimerase AraD [Candidatus Paceibacterota bacterium]
MQADKLRNEVCTANLELARRGLVTYTWGNVSGLDRERGIVAIKPSGVSYDRLTPETMVLLNLEGDVIEGTLNPSSDTPTHMALYRARPDIGGVAHTHSTYATAFAQACTPIPCLGTTHADHFHGGIPVTRRMTEEEVTDNYEANTGRVILETLDNQSSIDMPAILVANHGPFSWGKDCQAAVKNSVVLESVALMAFLTRNLSPEQGAIPRYLLDRHFGRKHGPTAYYGQPEA